MARNINGGTDHIYWTIAGVPVSVGTIAFWMRSTQATASAVPLGYWGSTSRNGWAFILNPSGAANKLQAVCYPNNSTPAVSMVSTASLNDGNPHHIALNYNRANGGANALFIDGVQDKTGNSAAAWTTASTGFFIQAGDQVDTFWATYVGDLWDVGHWGAQLAADEIAALAKGFSPKLIKPSSSLFYAPLANDAHDLRQAAPVNALVGTSVAAPGPALGGAV